MAQWRHTPAGVAYLRTPDDAFDGLDGYPFAPRYVEVEGLRLHYVDEGPRGGPVALLMHGMPTWSFLNRHIIGRLTAAGWRCVAADHLGFGRSDKPVDEGFYSIGRHAAAHRALITALDLRDVTLFVQDWGGPIGLAQAAEQPERFSRLVIMNTWLHHEGYDYTPALRQWNGQWQADGLFGINIPEPLSVGSFMLLPTGHIQPRDLFAVINGAGLPPLTSAAEAVRRGYDAPFAGLGREATAGVRRFPLSLPFDNPAGGAADDQARHFESLKAWTRPIHFIWGGADAVFTEAWGRRWAALYPQATFDLLPDAGHFLQETHGAVIAGIFLGHVAR